MSILPRRGFLVRSSAALAALGFGSAAKASEGAEPAQDRAPADTPSEDFDVNGPSDIPRRSPGSVWDDGTTIPAGIFSRSTPWWLRYRRHTDLVAFVDGGTGVAITIAVVKASWWARQSHGRLENDATVIARRIGPVVVLLSAALSRNTK